MTITTDTPTNHVVGNEMPKDGDPGLKWDGKGNIIENAQAR